MVGPVAAAGAIAASAAAAWMAWAVRGRASTVFAPSIWRGPQSSSTAGSAPEIALTFDDGPSESTLELLEVLGHHGVRATFFQCGVHVRRLPSISRQVAAAGHEIGNHTENHARLWLRTPAFLREEIGGAQRTLMDIAGATPTVFRAPYGVRWPGLGRVQREFGLTGVMWTVIGNDWALPAEAIARRVLEGANPGGIICLHDGRELTPRPDVRATVDAVREIVPRLLDSGYRFRTVGEWI